jgi:ADP-heptose:LPS heptosyltransferase
MKILIIILGRIGDMILSTPMFSAIKKKYPDSKIHVLAGRANHSIIRNNPYIDNIIVFDKTPNKLIGILLKLRKEHYDYLIDPKDHYSRESNLLARLINTKTKIGFNSEGKKIYDFEIPSFIENNELHYISRCFSALVPLGIETENIIPKPELFPSNDSIQYVENFLNHLTPGPSPKERGDREELSSLLDIESSKNASDEYGKSINHLTSSPSPKERGDREELSSLLDIENSKNASDEYGKSINHLTPSPSPKERGEAGFVSSDSPLRGVGGEVAPILKKLIVINLSAGSSERIWQTEKWLLVINNIDREKFNVIISYAPAEAPQANVLSENATDISLFPSRNLDDVIALIARVNLIITPDTSLVHVSSAFNRPIIGLFTSNEDVYKKFHPLSDIQEVIFPETDSYDIHNIRPEQVIEAFDKIREHV